MIKFKLYRQFGALNSKPVFDAFENSIKHLGHQIVENNEDVPVIWSVLWNGRMLSNKNIYESARSVDKPVVILEVGNLKRNTTWRVCVNHTTRLGYFGNDIDLDADRPEKIGVRIKNFNPSRKSEILIATQHFKSQQWDRQPPINRWLDEMVAKIRENSDRKIIVRPHPRSGLQLNGKNYEIQTAKKIDKTYDEFDIDYNYHCVINFNSGPAIQAAINGTPIICDTSSLAYPVSMETKDLENPRLLERDNWLINLCHTEWTIQEISQGIPLKRIEKFLNNH